MKPVAPRPAPAHRRQGKEQQLMFRRSSILPVGRIQREVLARVLQSTSTLVPRDVYTTPTPQVPGSGKAGNLNWHFSGNGAPQGSDQLGRADILSREMSLPKNISKDLCDLFRLMAADFPATVRENLVEHLPVGLFEDAVGDYFRVADNNWAEICWD